MKTAIRLGALAAAVVLGMGLGFAQGADASRLGGARPDYPPRHRAGEIVRAGAPFRGIYGPAGIVNKGALGTPPDSARENRSITKEKILFERKSRSSIQNHLPRYCAATKASLGLWAPLFTRTNV